MSRAAHALVACAAALACSAPQDAPVPQLEELVPAFPYASWFAEHTGFEPTVDFFGAYAVQPLSDALYVAFGAGLPAVTDGALLGVFDGQGMRAVAALDEQGVMDMATAGAMLLIPGVDPCCPDGWEAGNVYTYEASVGLIKWRNLPNVIHSWGAWYDASERSVYLATSAHPGDFATSRGEIWRSENAGADWVRLATGDDGVGSFRTYDVAGHDARLFAVAAVDQTACELVVRSAAGTWSNAVPGRRPACRHRLVAYGDELVALDGERQAVHALRSGAPAVTTGLPFTVPGASANWAAVADDDLYALADDGRVLVSRDLVGWETVVDAGRELVSIQYWPQRDRLVLASRGDGGALWTLRLCGADPC